MLGFTPGHTAQAAENYVANALSKQGWCLLARNFRGRGFELDIVAGKGQTLIIVEVKFRKTFAQEGVFLEALLPLRKRQALQRGALVFLSQNQLPAFATIRFDLALVVAPASKEIRPRLHYFCGVCQ